MESNQVLIQVLGRVRDVMRQQRVPCVMVGGLLRDQLLGRVPRHLNIDLAVPRDARSLCQALASELHGAYVPLDAESGCARVVVTVDGCRLELDVSDYRGATLQEDLARRDFTINAMAMALDDWLQAPVDRARVIDPLHGQEALARRCLVPCFAGTFDEDPVRILRAFRFTAQLGFTLDPSAPPLMAKAREQLRQVSGERIRDELLAIFETDQAAPAVRALNELGALDIIIPELSAGRDMDQGGFHHLDVLGHQLETVVQADRLLADCAEFIEPLRQPLMAYCSEQLVEGRSRKALIKLSGLLHDVGKPSSRQVRDGGDIWFIGHEHTGAALAGPITERLRLANREAAMVCQMVRHHLRPGFLSREAVLTRRAVYRFYRDLGEDGPACVLTWWADRMATRGPQSRLDQIDQQRAFTEELLRPYFFQAAEVIKPLRLLTGHDLMQQLLLQPGPILGELLALIEEAQAEGTVHTADEALALAREHLGRQRST